MTLNRPPLIEPADRLRTLALGTEWDEVRQSSSATGPFTAWAWIRAWLETEGANADLQVMTARDDDSGRLIGIAPFHVADTRRGGIGVRELRILGSGVAAPDHLDLIVHHDAPPGVAEGLWAAVTSVRRWDLIHLDGVAAGGYLARVATQDTDDQPESLPCPYLSLDGGWDVVAARFSSGLRKNLERYGRKLDRDADVVERMVTTPEDLDETFEHLVRLHQSIRGANGDPGLFARHDTQQFLRNAAHGFLETGDLRLWRLDANGMPIAVIWCVRSDASVAFYTTGYDTAWRKYGPGRQIMSRAINGAIDEGATEFDFLRGDEPYKRQWGTEMRHDLVIRRPTGPRGHLLAFGGGLARLSRRALRRAA